MITQRGLMYAAGLSESRPALDYLSLRRTFSAGHLSVGVLAPGAPRLHTGFELGEQEHQIHGFVELWHYSGAQRFCTVCGLWRIARH